MNEIFSQLRTRTAIAINHVGYELGASKSAVITLGGEAPFAACKIRDAAGKTVPFNVVLGSVAFVPGWHLSFQELDFSAFQMEGWFSLCAMREDGSQLQSAEFEIRQHLYTPRLAPLVQNYFASQRCVGRYEEADRAVPFVGQPERRVDVHGGWYDASGDVSKYLSHLSYANFMNPQQTPLVVWALEQAGESAKVAPELRRRFAAEAAYGADFLVRMCDPSGAFYMTVFDKWSGEVDQREICAYATQQGLKSDDWQAGYRQGGGMAIAALALAARQQLVGAFDASTYLATAKRAFAHLEDHNLAYLNDGRENIIDDYCALLAAIELCRATDDPLYHDAAKLRADRLLGRLAGGYGFNGWFWADDEGQRPFSHAADEGMPLVALSAYLSIARADETGQIVSGISKAVRHILAITAEVSNPFAYPRQLVRASDGEVRSQFFFPHENESGYWWQGENARLASLASALRQVAPLLDPVLAHAARAQAQRLLDWILGLNPYHSCMMQGAGRHVAQYGLAKNPNVDGGICNGITSSMTDEQDIAFCETEDPFQSWRWGEQWLPHSAWFLLALLAD